MIEDREPGRVAVHSLDDAMLIEDPLVDEAETAGRRAGGGVCGVALPFHAPVSEIVEGVRDEQEERLRRRRGALQIRTKPDVPNLDRTVIRLNAHQRGHALSPIARVRPDGEEEWVLTGRLSAQMRVELLLRGEGTVRQIVPDARSLRVAMAGREEGVGVCGGIERLDSRIATLVGPPIRARRR